MDTVDSGIREDETGELKKKWLRCGWEDILLDCGRWMEFIRLGIRGEAEIYSEEEIRMLGD